MEDIVKVEGTTLAPFASKEGFQNIFDIGKMFAASSLVPVNYQNKPMDCTIAVDMANRMGVNPMFVMQNLYIVQGKPSWSGQACMSMIRQAFKDAKPVYFGERNADSWGCRIEANGEKGPIIGPEVTIAMAKAEGWTNKTGSKWRTMPEIMLAYRAAAFFARIHIPNSLMGCSVEGEAEDTEKTVPEVKNPLEGLKNDAE